MAAVAQTFLCTRCSHFRSLTVRELLNHYNIVHSNEVNFQVGCCVEECPGTFFKYNSFYKHILRNHREAYNKEAEDIIVHNESEVENDFQEDQNSHINDSDNSSGENLTDESNFDDSSDEEQYQENQQQGVDIDIKKSAGSFILKIRERNKIPQVAMESVIDCTRSLVQQVLYATKKTITDSLPLQNIATLDEIFEDVENPFLGLESEWFQNMYIKNTFNHVEFREIPIGTKLVRKKSGCKRIISEKEETFVYIPILDSLKQLLSNERIASMILKEPELCREGTFYDICDGAIYKKDEFFANHKNALMLLLYHDELEVCNPLGSKAGKHKVDMYYYTLANIDPRYRSKLCAVRLLAIANANLVKKYGIDPIMKPIIDDIKGLYDGVIFKIGNVEKEIFGKVLMCTGDTLGQHLWGGFKEGVGVAHQKCRNCFCEFNNMQTQFKEEDFQPRTLQLYHQHCEEINNAPYDRVKNNLRTTYGINKKSVLTELPGFDVTKQLPQDIMHTLLEGCVQYEIRLVLLKFIKDGVLTLNQINGSIINHDYKESELSDKPGPLRASVFFGDEQYKLKYSASQARLFLRLFPFIIGPLVPVDDQYYLFIIELSKIVQIIFAPVIKLDTSQFLKELIFEHLRHFCALFPDKNILPKQHYLIHIPSMIQTLGPPIRSACFIFESAHKYFKELARKQNFKNLPHSLAKRHQFYECANFGDSKENPGSHPLFSSERNFGPLKKANPESLIHLREQFDILGLLPGIELENGYKANWVKLFGTKYTKSSVVAFNAFGDPPLPLFGKIISIWIIVDFVYFELSIMRTLCFNESKQSYEVSSATHDNITYQPYDRLVDFNVFYVKTDANEQKYIPVKYDIDDLLEEYIAGTSPI